MKMFKKVTAAVLAVLMLFAFAACGTNGEKNPPKTEPVNVNVATLKGPTGMGMAKLMSESKDGALNNNYTFNVATAPDQIVAAITGGKADIAACPINLASTLYNKTNGGVQMLAVNTLGVLYILENGNTVSSIADLRGKTLYATGKGSTPEYILNFVLQSNGLTPDKDVKIEYVAEHSELAAMLASGKVNIAMLPEPNVTSAMAQNSDLRIAADMTKEWEAVAEKNGKNGSTLVQGCIIVRKDFAEKNPEAVNEFMEAYKNSVEYTKNDKEGAAKLCEQMGIIPSSIVALKAMDNCNITFIEGDDMQNIAKDNLAILFEANNSSIGGAMPDDNFFYKR